MKGCMMCRKNDAAYYDGLTRVSVTVGEVFESQYPLCEAHWLLFRDYVRSVWRDRAKCN